MSKPSSPPPSSQVVSDNPDTQQVVEEALRSLWSVANSLSRIRPERFPAYRVTVFGSARIKPGEPLYESVKGLTANLARSGCDVVTGGGPGLMQAANEGHKLGDPHDKVKSIGVGIELPFEKGANPFVEQFYAHETFFTRLHQFVRLSSAFVVVGGGIGTTLETLMVWQLLQVRQAADLPVILVGDMWRELVAWGRKHMLSHEPQLASPGDFDLVTCVDSVDEAMAILQPHIDAFNAES